MDAEPHSKQRRTTKRSKADESESEESSSAPELQNFPKFIIIIPTGSKTISDLSPFWIQKALQASIGTLTSVRKTQAGHLLIQTANAHYSRRLLALTDLAGVPVRAEPHRTLNSCKGVIRCSDLKGLTKNKIVYTAGQLRGTNSIDKLITFDDGYRVLKDLCGFPPYCEKAKRDLYAMIRQLGPAQLFLTLSAAETRWVHHLKILSEVVDRKKEPISA